MGLSIPPRDLKFSPAHSKVSEWLDKINEDIAVIHKVYTELLDRLGHLQIDITSAPETKAESRSTCIELASELELQASHELKSLGAKLQVCKAFVEECAEKAMQAHAPSEQGDSAGADAPVLTLGADDTLHIERAFRAVEKEIEDNVGSWNLVIEAGKSVTRSRYVGSRLRAVARTAVQQTREPSDKQGKEPDKVEQKQKDFQRRQSTVSVTSSNEARPSRDTTGASGAEGVFVDDQASEWVQNSSTSEDGPAAEGAAASSQSTPAPAPAQAAESAGQPNGSIEQTGRAESAAAANGVQVAEGESLADDPKSAAAKDTEKVDEPVDGSFVRDTESGADPEGLFREIVGSFPSAIANFKALPAPFGLHIHHSFPDSGNDLSVYEDEPSSLIAYTLNEPGHRDFLAGRSFKRSSESKPRQSSAAAASMIAIFDEFEDMVGTRAKPSTDPPSILPKQMSNKLYADSHFKCQFSDKTTQFFCQVFFAKEFRELRSLFFCDGSDGESEFIRSLSRCSKWDPQGGKSRSEFCKMKDDRLIMKQMSRAEANSVIQFVPHYIEHVNDASRNNKPSVIAKIFGIFRIGFRNAQTGRAMRQDVIVMENLFCGRQMSRIFDLKGAFAGHAFWVMFLGVARGASRGFRKDGFARSVPRMLLVWL